ARHRGEDVKTRIVVIVASVADDDESRLTVERVHVFVVEIVERPAEVGVVVSAWHPPQNGGDRLVRVGAGEFIRNVLEMINEREGVRLAHLSLQGEKKTQ